MGGHRYFIHFCGMVYGEIKGSSEVHMHGILLPMVMSAVARIMDDTVCLRWGVGLTLCHHVNHCLFVVQQAEAT